LATRAERAVQTASGKEERPSLQKQLVQMQEQFQRAMPRGAEAVQLIRDVMTCISQNPKLAEADPMTVLGAAMTCAQLGLRPGVGALGQAWILPFYDSKSRGQKAQLIIGYKGYVELGQRSDRIGSLHSRIVYANDDFRLIYGLEKDEFEHVPYFNRGIDTPGDVRLFYAVGRLANGGTAMADPMTLAEMQAHRDKFAMARNREQQIVGPWRDHFDAMGRKTMLLRLMSLMPKSTELARAMDNDGAVRIDLAPDAIDTPAHIDGQVIDEEPAQITQERERVVVTTPADVVMATSEQLSRLKAIRAQEGYDTDTDWQSFVEAAAKVTVVKDSDLTEVQAAAVIDLFTAQVTG
jgi:recombination protein RecT